MDQIESKLTTVEQEIIISQLAPTIQAISKHYTNGLQYPSYLPTAMRLQFQESMAGFNRSYGTRVARSLVESCIEYDDFDTIVQSVSTTNTAEQNRLRNIIRATDTQSQQYLALTNLSNATNFLFISEQSDTTCDRCLSRHGKLYSIDDLKSGTSIPPLHPNCQCALVALDMAMTVQYNQYTQQFVEYVTNRLNGYSGLFQLSGNSTLVEITLSKDECAQIYHLVDASTSYDDSISLSSSIEQFVQWAMEFGGDAADVVDAFIQQSQLQLDNAADMLAVNPLFAIVLFADAMTGTVASSTFTMIYSLITEWWEQPSIYNTVNMVTIGWLETTERALNPEQQWSFQHFTDMLASVTFLFGAIFMAPKALSKLDDIVSQHLDDVARGSVDDVVVGMADDVVRPIVGDDLLNMTAQEVDDILWSVADEYGDIISTESANVKNTSILNRNPTYEPSYMPDTTTYQITLNQDTKFVRVYGGSSGQISGWIVRADDIAGLTPDQIKSKLSLPKTPEYICDVLVPAGTRLEVSGANGILGGLGGGVQFTIQEFLDELWFTNSKVLK